MDGPLFKLLKKISQTQVIHDVAEVFQHHWLGQVVIHTGLLTSGEKSAHHMNELQSTCAHTHRSCMPSNV